MTLIDLLRPEQRRQLRRLRKRIAKRHYMRRVREQRKLLCVGVDLPIDAGTCGRFVHGGYLRCIHCTRRHWPRWTGQIRPFVDTANPAISGIPRRHVSSTSWVRVCARI